MGKGSIWAFDRHGSLHPSEMFSITVLRLNLYQSFIQWKKGFYGQITPRHARHHPTGRIDALGARERLIIAYVV